MTLNPLELLARTAQFVLYAIPVRLGNRRHVDPNSLAGRIYSNRRDRDAGHVLLGDVVENAKSEWWGFTHRTPEGGYVMRDRHGGYNGNMERVPHRSRYNGSPFGP